MKLSMRQNFFTGKCSTWRIEWRQTLLIFSLFYNNSSNSHQFHRPRWTLIRWVLNYSYLLSAYKWCSVTQSNSFHSYYPLFFSWGTQYLSFPFYYHISFFSFLSCSTVHPQYSICNSAAKLLFLVSSHCFLVTSTALLLIASKISSVEILWTKSIMNLEIFLVNTLNLFLIFVTAYMYSTWIIVKVENMQKNYCTEWL